MKHIKGWKELTDIYRKTNTRRLLLQNGHIQAYRIAIGVYVVVTLVTLCFSASHFLYAVLLVFVTALSITCVFSWLLHADYAEIVKGAAIIDKNKYIKYFEFREQFYANHGVVKCDISSLLQWEEVRNEKFDAVNVVTNPLVLIILSAILSQLVSLVGTDGTSIKLLLSFIYFLIAVCFIIWAAWDSLSSGRRRKFEIGRFLKWIEIERESGI